PSMSPCGFLLITRMVPATLSDWSGPSAPARSGGVGLISRIARPVAGFAITWPLSNFSASRWPLARTRSFGLITCTSSRARCGGNLITVRSSSNKPSTSPRGLRRYGLGHCIVCGAWAKLEMWDDRLNGRFCVECFDYVVDAEELLASKGLVRPGPERKQPQMAEGKRLLLACAAS